MNKFQFQSRKLAEKYHSYTNSILINLLKIRKIFKSAYFIFFTIIQHSKRLTESNNVIITLR